MKKRNKQKNKNNNIAIKVEKVSKTFRVPHQKINSMRSAFVNIFNKKTYEEFIALDEISFEVKKGEFVGIIGKNGSGKSTLLKILAGVYEADKGKIIVNGGVSPFLELGIGFNPELSGRNNVYLNATILGLTRKEIDEKFDEIVKFSEIGKFIDQQVKNYSSGMKAKLAFSVSIHAKRDILLMDEVLAVGDVAFQYKCMNEFEKYKEQGRTVVLVSHSIDTVREYCDKVIFINDSKIAKSGNPEEVCDEYILKNMTKEQIEEQRVEKEKNKREKE